MYKIVSEWSPNSPLLQTNEVKEAVAAVVTWINFGHKTDGVRVHVDNDEQGISMEQFLERYTPES